MFLSIVPAACFKATTIKVAGIFLHLWKKTEKPQKGSESLSQRPYNREITEWVRLNSKPQILMKAINNHQVKKK
jgi:hypothetical protein